ncbi:MAG: phycobiliprotein lyase, partial [Microcystis aeruginosa SX13-01]|nr:phycobiliprotein lyase [Microcystis aeruginosa SX13-01]
LVLITEYETMTSIERFWFADADLRLRTSTVQRFGGFNTATFCAESRNQSSESVSGDSPEPSSYSISGW